MPRCQVEVTGRDGRIERVEVEAISVFDAGYQALDKFALLWWWDAAKLITVRRHGPSGGCGRTG
jgi:hypothetical protein